MDDARGVRVREARAGRGARAQQGRVAERAGAQRGAEVTAVDELGDDVDVVVVPRAVEQPHHVRVIEPPRDLDLALRAAAQRRVVRDRLDRHERPRSRSKQRKTVPVPPRPITASTW